FPLFPLHRPHYPESISPSFRKNTDQATDRFCHGKGHCNLVHEVHYKFLVFAATARRWHCKSAYLYYCPKQPPFPADLLSRFQRLDPDQCLLSGAHSQYKKESMSIFHSHHVQPSQVSDKIARTPFEQPPQFLHYD